jgi:acyl carrier protein
VSNAAPPPLIDQLRQLLAEVTGLPELAGLPAATPLLGPGLGLGSLAGTLLLRRIRDQFGVDIAAEDLNLDALATLGTLTAYVGERAGGCG